MGKFSFQVVRRHLDTQRERKAKPYAWKWIKGDALRFSKWDEEDSIIRTWLLNSMVTEISNACFFIANTKEIWYAGKVYGLKNQKACSKNYV